MERALKKLKTIVSPPQSEAVVRLSDFLILSSMTFASNPNLKEAPKRSQLIEVLLGMATPSRCNITHDIPFFDGSLNDSQKAAVKFALESVEVACIHGPPGE
jgi:DNA polymerase alpha-associated DNA helicase A